MPLSDASLRNAKPASKPFKLADSKGLFLLVRPTGGKLWRFKYRFAGKEKLLALGSYPETSLKQAREYRDAAKLQIGRGIDPSALRKAEKASQASAGGNTFELVGREWFARLAPQWAPSHSKRVLGMLKRDLFPWLGKRPVKAITAPELLAVLRRIEGRGAIETAHRARSTCGLIFRYAIATGRLERDVSSDLRGALPPAVESHFPAVTDPAKVAELLRMLDSYQGSFIVACALKLAPLLFVRPGELRQAEWAAIDLKTAEWRFTVSKTKSDHIVPLPTQAVVVLKELHGLTGGGRYVFPSARGGNRPMSDNAVLAAMRRLSIPKDEMTGHGFRAMARTILDEVLGFRPDFIEHQLAHAVRDPNGRAYNRTAHLPERRKMMQAWADYLDALKSGAGRTDNVVRLARAD